MGLGPGGDQGASKAYFKTVTMVTQIEYARRQREKYTLFKHFQSAQTGEGTQWGKRMVNRAEDTDLITSNYERVRSPKDIRILKLADQNG